MVKRMVLLTAAALTLMVSVCADSEFAPYNSYIYNSESAATPVPNAYLPESIVLGTAAGAGEFSSPEDFFVWNDELIFVSDTGHDRIVVLDASFKTVDIIDELNNSGVPDSLSGPNGIYVTENGEIYVCDTGNSRVLVLDRSGRVIRSLTQPASGDYPQNAGFGAVKVAVNSSGNAYVVVKGVYQGAVVFDKNGKFSGFYGTANVESTLQIVTQAFFKKFMTKEQRKKVPKFVPTEFINLDIADDFVYTCTNDTNLMRLIRKFNPAGKNIANNTGIFGDYDIVWDSTVNASLSSQFVDVAIDKNGYIYALDNTYGKVFIYDENFRQLFIFGIKATTVGALQFPAAIDKLGDRLLVLDKGKNCFFSYAPTDFFACVEKANMLYNQGLYEEAIEPWREVLRYCSNYEPAYNGLGKAMYTQNKYEKAMGYFRAANNRADYSSAFKYYRAGIIQSNFTFIMLAFIALFALICAALMNIKKIVAAGVGLSRRIVPARQRSYIKYPLYNLFHPFEGFEEMRNKEKSSYTVSAGVVAVWFVSQLMAEKATGFIFRAAGGGADMVVMKTLVLFCLWAASNWGLRTFLAGRGKMRDIVSATAYSLIPYTFFSFVYVIVSNFLILEEAMFLNLLLTVGLLWSGLLLIAGMKGVHEYEFGRTIVSILLTALGVLLIVFLAILFYSSLQQVFDLVVTIFSEIKYRA